MERVRDMLYAWGLNRFKPFRWGLELEVEGPVAGALLILVAAVLWRAFR